MRRMQPGVYLRGGGEFCTQKILSDWGKILGNSVNNRDFLVQNFGEAVSHDYLPWAPKHVATPPDAAIACFKILSHH